MATEIERVEIDSSGRLLVLPGLAASRTMPSSIAQEWASPGMPTSAVWSRPAPWEWNHFDWFRHLVSAVEEADGDRLVLSESTFWSGVSPELRDQMEQWSGGGRTSGGS